MRLPTRLERRECVLHDLASLNDALDFVHEERADAHYSSSQIELYKLVEEV